MSLFHLALSFDNLTGHSFVLYSFKCSQQLTLKIADYPIVTEGAYKNRKFGVKHQNEGVEVDEGANPSPSV